MSRQPSRRQLLASGAALAMGLAVGHTPQQQLASRGRAYTQAWAKIIKASGFQPQ